MDRVDEMGRQRNNTMSRGRRDRQSWQIDLRRDKVGFSCCRMKKRGWWHKVRYDKEKNMGERWKEMCVEV